MIIDFTVENFRSIKEPVTLSMVAQSRPKKGASTRAGVKRDDEIARPYPIGNRGIEVLPAAGIFGPNASGKSNVIGALNFLLVWMAHGSAWNPDNLILITPFGLDQDSIDKPTRFDIRIAVDEILYAYALRWHRNRIVFERLERYLPLPLGKRTLFERSWKDGEYVWKNGTDFKGPHILLEESLQPHEPLISLLMWRITVRVTILLTDWIMNTVMNGGNLSHDDDERNRALGACFADSRLLQRVSRIISELDTGVSGIDIELRSDDKNPQQLLPFARHQPKEVPVVWSFNEESDGTQKLFSLATAMLRAFDRGTVILVDDFGSSLHPEITHAIVRMFQDEKLNPKRAQLIFNSHDYTLMHGNLLRRDQIWFTQKRKDGSTELYPLTDFHPRNDLAIDKAYIDGRFGAVPILPADEDLLPAEELVG